MFKGTILLLPGWQDSGPEHWQSHWERLHGDRRVKQHDWHWPKRGDWVTRLEDVVSELIQGGQGPVALVAHSLGCWLIDAWSRTTQIGDDKIAAALMVAPPDLDQADTPTPLLGWRTPAPAPLRFRSLVIASDHDSYCRAERAADFAAAWRADFLLMQGGGHLNDESGLGAWPQARVHLLTMLN